MKDQFVYIILFILLISCAKNASKETDIEASPALKISEDVAPVSVEDVYAQLIQQKIQEELDKKTLTKAYPNFIAETHQDELFSTITDSIVKEIHFIEPFITISDTLQTVKTKVIFESKIDTILTKISTSEIDIEGKKLQHRKISFDLIKNTQKKPAKKSLLYTPRHAERFSLRDLNFTWEEINACDCLFMVMAKNTLYKRLYFGRLKGDTTAIVQLGKNTEKLLIPVARPRSKNRIPGKPWKEIYQNNQHKIQLKATPTRAKVKGKHTYFIDFTFTDFSTKKKVNKTILANCTL